ncbi:MAG: ABC transporter permease subunit, partial [Alphaproteobacteria bacterium]|nr:ABC transporter permease subunit [Alphaproteobacteria bacterium]
EYSMQTSFRMLVAIIFATLFGIIYGLIAAKFARLEVFLVPLLDVLQSVPILGFISFTITGFLNMFPGRMMGAELAVIFAIFTSQAWNIAFAVYASIKNLPKDFTDLAKVMQMSPWLTFWILELPYAAPAIIWNVVVSMSGGWFFIVASEVIIVGDHKLILDGVGSYIALSISEKNTNATMVAIFAMCCMIIIYDQLILRPLVVWSEKFKCDSAIEIGPRNRSWALELYSKSRICLFISHACSFMMQKLIYTKILCKVNTSYSHNFTDELWRKRFSKIYRLYNFLLNILLTIASIYIGIKIFNFIDEKVDFAELLYVCLLAVITWSKIMILIFLASLIWVPIGVAIGLNPRLAAFVQPFTQFLAAFPINLLFPFVYLAITKYQLNPEIWLSPMMIVGTQWYILFNVVGAVNRISGELRDVAKSFKIRGITRWKNFILPSILPHYITGAITACGASWNASIVAEVVSYGDKKIVATGIGSYIAAMTVKADFPRIALGVVVMAFFVVVFNKIFWQKLYDYAAKKCNI